MVRYKYKTEFGVVEYFVEIKTDEIANIIKELDKNCTRLVHKGTDVYAKTKAEALKKFWNKNEKEVVSYHADLEYENNPFDSLNKYTFVTSCLEYSRLAKLLQLLLDVDLIEKDLGYYNSKEQRYITKDELASEVLDRLICYDVLKEEKGHDYGKLSDYYHAAIECLTFKLNKICVNHDTPARTLSETTHSKTEGLSLAIYNELIKDEESERKRSR